ncbi:peptidase inhibitor family I36 protein [Saccharothrix sp. HUAS TT1]|uniref:peptidase inhibitor family I36 protein n=1 Tax=unclassified Saccharothrix TaxID=2593673 RepID=UPI00345C1A09
MSCTSGNVCVWPVTDGSSSRCSWSNADNDWRSTPVTCSWSSSRPVKAIYNRGTSTAYDGVCLYRGANYTSPEIWVPQGASAINSTGVILRSHRWVRPSDPC